MPYRDTWTTADGVTMMVRDMTNSHLHNAIRWCERWLERVNDMDYEEWRGDDDFPTPVGFGPPQAYMVEKLRDEVSRRLSIKGGG